jgi:hypothetical protein
MMRVLIVGLTVFLLSLPSAAYAQGPTATPAERRYNRNDILNAIGVKEFHPAGGSDPFQIGDKVLPTATEGGSWFTTLIALGTASGAIPLVANFLILALVAAAILKFIHTIRHKDAGSQSVSVRWERSRHSRRYH